MSAFGPNVSVPSDVRAAEWIRSRLGEFGTVGGLIPSGFDACLLVDHRTAQRHQGPAPPELVAELAAAAAEHTSTPTDAWFAIWTGYGWTRSRNLISVGASRRRRRILRRAEDAGAAMLESELSSLPRFDLPNRDYYLLQVPLSAASRIQRPDGHGLQAPDLWWPNDGAWFMATDTDLSWTYVGGTRRLMEDIVGAVHTRSMPVDRSEWNGDVGEVSD